MSLQRALLLLIAAALFAGIVPTAIVTDRRLAREVEARVRDDIAQAPRLLADRNIQQAEAMVMHAKDLARAPGLIEALVRGDRTAAIRAVESARGRFGDASVLVNAKGEVWAGLAPSPVLLQAAERGETPTGVVADSGALHLVTLVSLRRGAVLFGAVGISVALSRSTAGTLAALSRADVLVLGAHGALVASTPDSVSPDLRLEIAAVPRDGVVHVITVGQKRYVVTSVAAGEVGTIAFVRDLSRDLAVLPDFRRILVFGGIAAVLIGLLLGTIVAQRIARPVKALADAADRLAAGDVDAPLMHSSIREIARLSDAFAAMRQALSVRIDDVTGANRRLTDRQARFETSQSELLQRERLAVSGRLVAELAHEIRNPIANLRNCLEVIRRRVDNDAQGREFTDLAIDELLRMHELAEQLLDLNRPRDPAVRIAHVDTVVHEVVLLASAGWSPGMPTLEVTHLAGNSINAAIAPDSLKQVLMNLVQNAREAFGELPANRRGDADDAEDSLPRIFISSTVSAGRVVIDVTDNGPGIADDVLPHLFDPFFTTKGAAHGIGLGLFVAEGLMRTAGGHITIEKHRGSGVTFRVEIPIALA